MSSTQGNVPPIRVPPHPIPFHYADSVHAQLSQKDSYPIQRANDDLQQKLANKKIFSKTDLRSSY